MKLASHSWSPRREKIAWRAMQEEQAEKRKAVAREEARAWMPGFIGFWCL